MAEMIDAFPAISRTRAAKYPWAEWTNGAIWKVSEGIDFESNPKTFGQGLYAFAKRHEMKVEVRTDPTNGVVMFRFLTGAQTVDSEPEAA